MLKTLTVWNFALLEHVQIDFDAGLNILTGETGAGKSILIDALGAILGSRVPADAIRTGADWLRVEAVFSIAGQEELHALLASQAIDDSEGTLIVTRQVARAGRSVALVNGCHVTLAVLRQIGALLVDIHGQNQNLALLKEASQYDLLDSENPATKAALERYRACYAAWVAARQALEKKQLDAREYAQRLDMLKWQKQEIEDAHLKPGEEEDLENQIQKLSHAEKIADGVREADAFLNSDARGALGVLSALSEVKKQLGVVGQYDKSLENAAKIVDEAFVTLQEAAYEIRDYGESMSFSAAELDKLQRRMDVIYKLRKKYGATVEDVLAHQAAVCKELAAIENYDADLAALQKNVAQAEMDLQVSAKQLSALRAQGAAVLTEEIGGQLAALGMKKARFAVEVTPLESFSPRGADAVGMLFSANPGEAMRPLAKVASGGELSRIALAIKAVSASRDQSVPSMVFDEIDTGIGGRTAQMVAERIALVAKYKQVLCITHLPQIACMADVHLYIAKHEEEGHTVTEVTRLTEAQEVNEIARMASGSDLSAASLDNAREMLTRAHAKKQKF